MKLTFEMHGYTIVIEETEENLIKVSAEKDGEEVESFELEGGEDHPSMDDESLPEEGGEGDEGQEIKGETPESDFEGTEEGGSEEEKPMGESKLYNFAAFLKRK
jgi:hypothetical protein